jgi:ATP-dependent helicase HepA
MGSPSRSADTLLTGSAKLAISRCEVQCSGGFGGESRVVPRARASSPVWWLTRLLGEVVTFPLGALLRDSWIAGFDVARVVSVTPEGLQQIASAQGGVRQILVSAQQTRFTRLRLAPGTPVRVRNIDEDGAETKWSDGEVVRSYDDPTEPKLWVYLVREGNEDIAAAESRLVPLGIADEPLIDVLQAGTWRGPGRFGARRRLLATTARWYEDSDGIPALLGARIRPLAHQIYAARRVLWDRVPRFILADEVGLGKTIEAGLVIQALVAEDPTLRVLVIAPGGMSRQWLCELYLRFGARAYVHVDGARLNGASRKRRGEWAAAERLIVSTTALAESSEFAAAVLDQHWDLAVIDEAHQFAPPHPLYGILQAIAERSPGVLVLSATPSKGHVDGLLALLALVAPDVYRIDDRAGLEARLAIQNELWDRLGYSSRLVRAVLAEGKRLGAEDAAELAGEWSGLLDGDPVVSELLARMRGGDGEAVEELLAYVQEFHRIDHRIIRTRRATLGHGGQGLNVRTRAELAYEASAAEDVLADHLLNIGDPGSPMGLALRGLYWRMFSTTADQFIALLIARRNVLAKGEPVPSRAFDPLEVVASDQSPADEQVWMARLIALCPPLEDEASWLESALGLAESWRSTDKERPARFMAAARWIGAHLGARASNKVLVFTQEPSIAAAFAKFLRASCGTASVEAFHDGLEIEALSGAALRFQRDNSCRVLVSDELGGEGRNFQVASVVLHLDIPWSVARVEQRIGRLDRVGREERRAVHSVVVRGPSAMERALYQLHNDVFEVFTRSVGGLEFVLPMVHREVVRAACCSPQAVEELLPRLKATVVAELGRVDDAFEWALESSRLQLEDAAELATLLDDIDGGGDAEEFTAWGRQIGVRMRVDETGRCDVAWRPDNLPRPLLAVGTPTNEDDLLRRVGTYTHADALEDESLQFFAAGHVLIDALARDALVASEAKVSVFQTDLGGKCAGRVFALVLGRRAFDRSRWGDVEMTAGLVHRAHRRLWPEPLWEVVELQPDADIVVAAVVDPQLRRTLDSADRTGKKLEPEKLAASFDLKQLWSAVGKGIAQAMNSMRGTVTRDANRAADELASDLEREVGYLRGIIARSGGASGVQAIRDLDARARLIDSVRCAHVELDGIAIIVGKGART